MSAQQHLLLKSNAFADALHCYIDEEKPDPLQKRQMEAWKLEWQPQQKMNPVEGSKLDFEPTNVVSGSLEWTGDHLVVTLKASCYWVGGNKEQSDGALFFQCWASARFPDIDSDTPKKEAKIEQKMRERLQNDDYIAKLLRLGKNSKVLDASTVDQEEEEEEEPAMELCQASVKTGTATDAQLEERVYCNETAAEAIRRAVYSTAPNGPIDVFEFVCSLPLLPTQSTTLASRAKLRLLEDAMYDACENEGEEELVQDLKLEQQQQQQQQQEQRTDDEDDDAAATTSKKRGKKSKVR